MPDPSAEFDLVPYEHGRHRNFVFSAFLESVRHHPEFGGMPRPVLFRVFQALLGEIVAGAPAERWKTQVAQVKGDPDSFAGFVIASDCVVFWIYVARPYRRLGLGRSLLQATGWSETASRVRHAMRPRDWVYKVAIDKGIRLVFHSGEVPKLLAGMWWAMMPESAREEAEREHPGSGTWHG